MTNPAASEPTVEPLPEIPEPFMHSALEPYFPLVSKGKVRDIYKIDENKLLFVATDRVSAYDVILENGLKNKGTILALISAYWFKYLAASMPDLRNHFVGLTLPSQIPESIRHHYQDRTMVVNKFKIFPIESIVRGYLAGSLWQEYSTRGTINGVRFEKPLEKFGRLPMAVWTPSTKAENGAHDVNLTPDEAANIIGQKYADRIQSVSVTLYNLAAAHSYARGFILADTKFEFGLDVEKDEIILVDEVLTPDCSRFWSLKELDPDGSPASYDKQFIRNWLKAHDMDGKEGVSLPEDVMAKAGRRYWDAYSSIVGKNTPKNPATTGTGTETETGTTTPACES